MLRGTNHREAAWKLSEKLAGADRVLHLPGLLPQGFPFSLFLSVSSFIPVLLCGQSWIKEPLKAQCIPPRATVPFLFSRIRTSTSSRSKSIFTPCTHISSLSALASRPLPTEMLGISQQWKKKDIEHCSWHTSFSQVKFYKKGNYLISGRTKMTSCVLNDRMICWLRAQEDLFCMRRKNCEAIDIWRKGHLQ